MRVTFRATFQDRKGLLDTGAFRFPNPPVESIEIYRRVDKWFARVGKVDIPQLGSEPSHGAMKDTVASNFEKQVSKWEMWGPDGLLDPARVEEDPKGNFTLKEMIHVGKPGGGSQTSPQGANYFETACGVTVHVKQLRSVRSQHPPDCPTCKAVWEKTPEEQRLKA